MFVAISDTPVMSEAIRGIIFTGHLADIYNLLCNIFLRPQLPRFQMFDFSASFPVKDTIAGTAVCMDDDVLRFAHNLVGVLDSQRLAYDLHSRVELCFSAAQRYD